jgi:hypothetical protein
MDVQVNWLAIMLATASTLVIGSVWYTPKVFGNLWMKLAKINPSKSANATMAISLSVAASFITAFVLAHAIFLSNSFFQNSFLQDALSTGFWLWLGLTATRVFVHDLFENRPKMLTLLTVGHEFATIMIMALIIGLLKP